MSARLLTMPTFAAGAVFAALAALATVAACNSGSNDNGDPGSGNDAAVNLPGKDAAPGNEASSPACVTTPQTYLDIINACTDAQAVDKTDDLSVMNLPDGGLRPLP